MQRLRVMLSTDNDICTITLPFKNKPLQCHAKVESNFKYW